MTTENVELQAMLGTLLMAGDGDFLRGVLVRALRQVMEAEVSAVCNAAYGERTDDRLASRNGYRPRTQETRVGTVDLQVPKLHRGSDFLSFLEPRGRWEKAFVNVVSEAYVLCLSTRRVEELVEAMGAKGMSKSEVSRMAAVLDEQVQAFRTRPLGDRTWPYLWLDALYLKVREGGRVVSKVVLVAYGVDHTGERQVPGCGVAKGEMQACWWAFLERLVDRGLSGTLLVVSDAHTGPRAAIRAMLNGVAWQRCCRGPMDGYGLHNVLSRLPRKAQSVSAAVRAIIQQPDRASAREAVTRAIELLEPRYPDAAAVIRGAEDDVLACMGFPEKHRRWLKSTNPLERLDREIPRRTYIVDGSLRAPTAAPRQRRGLPPQRRLCPAPRHDVAGRAERRVGRRQALLQGGQHVRDAERLRASTTRSGRGCSLSRGSSTAPPRSARPSGRCGSRTPRPSCLAWRSCPGRRRHLLPRRLRRLSHA